MVRNTHTLEEEIKREKLFNENGFNVLFLHYEDLKNEVSLIEKIREFENGAEETIGEA